MADAIKMVLAIVCCCHMVGIGGAIYAGSRRVRRALIPSSQPMQALGSGDLTAQVPHQGETTEIGSMADALQVFKDALIAKKAADEAAAVDAEAKIQRGQPRRRHHP